MIVMLLTSAVPGIPGGINLVDGALAKPRPHLEPAVREILTVW